MVGTVIAATWGTTNRDNATVILAELERYGGDADPLIVWAKAQIEEGKADQAAAAPMWLSRDEDVR
jgi:hypothetical protein